MRELRKHLICAIAQLPVYLDGDMPLYEKHNPSQALRPVMRHWTTTIPLRHQGVLISAVRGADGAPKEDSSKHLTRMLRRAIMNPADERETTALGGFFGFNPTTIEYNIVDFMHSMDQYPLHYIVHLMHACEVVWYKHPDDAFRAFFQIVYAMFVSKLHLNSEDSDQMDHRLTLDRVANNTVETDL